MLLADGKRVPGFSFQGHGLISLGRTVVFVTHDLAEAIRLSSRVIVFEAGAVIADLASTDVVRDRTPLVQRLVASATLPAEVA